MLQEKLSQVTDILSKQGVILSDGAIRDIMASQDPTKNKRHLSWIADGLINKTISWDDLISGDTSLKTGLKRFEGLKYLGLSNSQNLSTLYSIKDLKSFIKKRRSHVLAYDSQGAISFKLTTNDAISKWCQGTRWQELENVNLKKCNFIKLKNGIKLLGVSPDTIIDKDNKAISQFMINENWDDIQNVMINFPKLIPSHYMTHAMALKIIRNNPRLISELPEKIKDYSIYKLAVSYDGQLLYHVPPAFKNRIVCETAVRQNEASIHAVPRHHQDEDMWSLTVSHNPSPDMFNNVPEEFRSYGLYVKAVQNNGNALAYVPADMKDYALCLLAVRQNGMALQHVPDNMVTEHLTEVAVQNDGRSIQFVHESKHTYKLYLDAVMSNPDAIAYIPEKFHAMLEADMTLIENNSLMSGISQKIHEVTSKFKI